MQLEKVQCTTKASAAGGFGLLSRFLVVLFAATMPLATPVALLAQQPAQTAGQNQGAAAITKTQTETAMTQPGIMRSYDSMASLIAPYGSQAALAVAGELDEKIEGLLETAAR
jgi:hypothetical protein